MKIHKEGFVTIFIVIIFLALLNYVVSLFAPNVLLIALNLLSLSFFIFILSFFRSPNRSTEIVEDAVLSPCDGKVVAIETVKETEYFNDERIQVSIFMSPLNVHVNWFPISGIVKFFKYHPGAHLVAWHPKSSTENERSTVVVETSGSQEVLFRQIAGAVARRVVCYAQEGTKVNQGDETGFIKFGSRVDVFLPTTANIQVNIGQIVKGKNTILANI